MNVSAQQTIATMAAPPVAADQFANWRQRLMGVAVPLHEGEPDSGFYRNRNVPYAYWRDVQKVSNGPTRVELRCHIAGKECTNMDRALTAWPFASKEPVTKKFYDTFLTTGTWPDQSAAVTNSNNSPADDNSIEGLTAQINMLADEADGLIKKGAAQSQREADLAADVATRLGELWGKADELRKVEKRPHWDKAVAVDSKWRPLLDTAAIYSSIKAAIISPFLRAENARLQAAQAAAQKVIDDAAKETKRLNDLREAEHLALLEAAAAEGAPPPPPLATIEAPPPAVPFEAPVYAPASAGTRGKKVSARTKKVAVIENYALALAHFAQHADVKDVVQKLADQLAKVGHETPGCKIVDEGSAV